MVTAADSSLFNICFGSPVFMLSLNAGLLVVMEYFYIVVFLFKVSSSTTDHNIMQHNIAWFKCP